ncbi:MAG: peptidase domain-containing protein [Methanoregula sp.]
MKVYRNALLGLIVAALLLAPIVSAQNSDKNTILVVEPGYNYTQTGMSVRSIDWITQGETDYFSKYVSSGTTQLVVDLNWGTLSNTLSLTINSPTGQYGPYYDSADGVTDGRTVLRITRSGQALPSGTWSFRVYGEQVTGNEDYTFVAY